MMKNIHRYALLWILVYCTFCKGQHNADIAENKLAPENADEALLHGPNSISRTIIQDRSGNIWIASWQGVFRYDGKAFTNVTSEVSSSRFFSVLEDRKSDMWFGSIGSGVYYYDGGSFQNFTTNDGLVSNTIVCIYEDKVGNIWFGANGGVNRYNGKSFRNYRVSGDAVVEETTRNLNFTPKERPPRTINEVNAIIEDKSGKFWFGTRGYAFRYDGKTFTTLTHSGQPFTNVRWIIEDKRGNIWLGGTDGLWRYDGRTFTNITQNFVGYIYEDNEGNIWTSSQNANDGRWALSRYDEKSLFNEKPTVTEIISEYEGNKGMIFGLLEADDGSIWFGALDGVHRYDGNTITDFKSKEGQE